jgi:protein TonB
MEEVKDYSQWAMDDIVFENRNKAYGSYQNKHAIPTHIMIGLAASVLGFVMLVLPFAIDWSTLRQMPDEKEKITAVNLATPVITLYAPPPPPPPPPVLPPPIRPSVRFTEILVKQEPEIEEDEEVNETPVEETIEQEISTVTNVGDTSMKVVKPDTLPPVVKEVPVDTTVYEFVDQRPEFPGGDAALNSFVKSHIRYPDEERLRRMEGEVLVVLVVREDGSVSDVRVPIGASSGFTKEALRVVKTLPKFMPGRLQGRAVRVYFHIPVSFSLKSI